MSGLPLTGPRGGMDSRALEALEALDVDSRWRIIAAYFEHFGHTRFQTEGFNLFMRNLLPHIVGENSAIEVASPSARERHQVVFGDRSGSPCTIFPPSLREDDGTVHAVTPAEARTRKLTYGCAVVTDITHTVARYGDVVDVAEALLRPPGSLLVVLGHMAEGPAVVGAGGERLELAFDEVPPPGLPPPGASAALLGLSREDAPFAVREGHHADSARGTELREALVPELVVRRTVTHRREVPLFQIPCMVQSDYCSQKAGEPARGECPFDDGGYFIINGIEKVLVGQQKLRINKCFVFPGKASAKWAFAAEVRSCHPTKWRSTSTLKVAITRSRPPEVVALVPFVSRGCTPLEIPLACLLKVLGCADRDAMEAPVYATEAPGGPSSAVRDIVDGMLAHPASSMTAQGALAWIGQEGTKEKSAERQLNYCRHILRNELIPHLGMANTPDMFRLKAAYIGMMCLKLARVYAGESDPSDRDHQANRRLDGPGPLLAILFRQLYRNHLKTVRSQLVKAIAGRKLVSIGQLFNFRKITSGVRFHFATGNWSLQKGVNTGVVQVLSRMSVAAMCSHLRRVSTPINRDGKNSKPRQLDPSAWGLVCPAESPEGASCGLIKNLAMLTHVSTGQAAESVRGLMGGLGVRAFELDGEGATVFLNGDIVGRVDDGAVFAAGVRDLRRDQAISFEVSVVFVDHTCLVHLDPGRLMRPLFVLARLGLVPAVLARVRALRLNAFLELCWAGAIEYLDKQEEEASATVAIDAAALRRHPARYTHMEIDPNTMFGSTVASIPFSDRNQAPRNIYQASMGKQSITMPMLSYATRVESTHMHVLQQPQKPLVSTRFSRIRGVAELPTGLECIVAIACFDGFNQEDSILANEGSLQRGLGAILYYRTFRDSITTRGTEEESFEVPPADAIGLKGNANYATLDDDGFAPVGRWVSRGDAVIGKVVNVRDYSPNGAPIDRKRCRSTVLKKNEQGYVDKVVLTTDRDGMAAVTVRLRQLRTPMVGDKLSSRHGQKGTIGRVVPEADMFFSPKTGMTPDLVINPQAIPSRMTIGQLIECILGKASALAGRRGDGTAFSGVSVDTIGNELEKYGWNRYGNERMCSGRTGRMMRAAIFVGPTYYQRLKHMVADKVHSRSTGPRQSLTRQPMEGRSREGGLRFGEMERDAVIGHGAAHFLRDRLCVSSDISEQFVCKECRMLADPPRSRRFGVSVRGTAPYCHHCRSSAHVVPLTIPYSAKLLHQELTALHIGMRLTVSPNHTKGGPP